MIYLTGDVHSSNMGGWEQKKVGSEIKAAKRYLEILKKYNLSCTLFINGICLEENWEDVHDLLQYNFELGGHTYNNFGKMNIFKSYINRKLFGCIYGSKSCQRRDIKRTKSSFLRRGINLKSWRTHAFGSNETTFELLKADNIVYVSDLVGEIKPFNKDGVVHLPINIPADVTTLAYGELRPENTDQFASCTKGRISAEEWFEIMKKRIISNEKNKIESVLLIHPATMDALDNFKLFEEIAKFLSKYKLKKISEFQFNESLRG